MSRGKFFLRAGRAQLLAMLAVAVVLSAVAVHAVYRLTREGAEKSVREAAERTLDAQVQTILGQLEKYRHLPALTARRQDVRAVAEEGPQRRAVAEAVAFDVHALSAAIDVAFFTPSGETIASSGGFLTAAMVTNNELFVAPLQNRLGRASVSGADGRRAYAFSSAIRGNAGIGAIMVVAAPLEAIEQTWALSANPIFAVNSAGQFVAGNQLARGRENEIRAALRRSRDGQAILEDGGRDGYLAFRRPIALMDWTLYVLEPTAAVAAPARNAAVVAGLSAALVLIGTMALLARLQDAHRRQRFEKAAALRLERRVRDRTRELRDANARLEVEIEERDSAQRQLRAAQTELVQSAKLAAIGQMSAALAHEYSQPLAAIRSYAANALRFLERKRFEPVGDNLGRIEALVERMATLSKTLKSFARRPRSELRDVALDAVMRDAALLAGHRAKESGIAIRVDYPPPAILVRAGPVRLSQVLLNLLSNAIDASLETGAREIDLTWAADGNEVRVEVADRGSGIARENHGRLFDPFFTTKEVGSGLGLGLSIAYNIVQDFGGSLVAANRDGGGAVFIVRLPRAGVLPAEAAE